MEYLFYLLNLLLKCLVSCKQQKVIVNDDCQPSDKLLKKYKKHYFYIHIVLILFICFYIGYVFKLEKEFVQ